MEFAVQQHEEIVQGHDPLERAAVVDDWQPSDARLLQSPDHVEDRLVHRARREVTRDEVARRLLGHVRVGLERQKSVLERIEAHVRGVFGGDFGDGSDYGEQVTISNELTLARASAERPTIEGKVNIGDQSETTLNGEVVIDGVEMATTDSGVTDGVVSVGDRQQKIENATIKNSVIDIDLSQSGVGVGIYTEEVDNLAMENNAFTESGSGTSVAYNAAESPVNTIEMSENTLTDVDRLYNEGAGFIKGRGISSTTVRIVDNDVNGAGTAIGIGDSDDALDTVDYVISGNQIDASTVGILQNGGDPASFTIENNEFSSSSIYVDDSANPILKLGDILNNQNNTFTPSAEVVGEQIVPE